MIKERLEEVDRRYAELSRLLAMPDTMADQALYRGCAKEHASLTALVEAGREFRDVEAEAAEYKRALEGKDEVLRELAKEELPALQRRLEELSSRVKILLLPRDPNDERSVILEIRAGARLP